MFTRSVKMMSFLAVLIVLFDAIYGQTSGYVSLHQRMSNKERQGFFGIEDPSDVPEYDIVHPYRSDDNGRFSSFKLHPTSEPQTNFVVRGLGKKLHLKLSKADDFVVPGAKLTISQSDGSKVVRDLPKSDYYEGHVVDQPDSKVALSHDAKGLMGAIQLQDDSLLIKPVPSHLAKHYVNSLGTRPHIIHRRSLKELKKRIPFKSELLREKKTETLTKKSEDPKKYLELYLIADQYYMEGKADAATAEKELLNIAYLTRLFFLDSSVGKIKLNIVVVGVEIKNDFSYERKANGSDRLKMLDKYITSQRTSGEYPSNDDDPLYADAFVVVSRYIAGGRARAKSICTGTGIAVSNDVGLDTTLIITHELTHALGPDHDVGQKPTCPGGTFVMAKSLGGRHAFKFSPCSKEKLQAVFRGDSCKALDDEPGASLPLPNVYAPGKMYSADAQCQLMYNINYRVCRIKGKNFCQNLFCRNVKSGGCQSIFAPPLDRTACGERQWCVQGECVDNGSPYIDGGWSEWGAWSSCSYSCDGGVQYRPRTCTNPRPKNGGKQCVGETKKWRICNPQACSGKVTYRDAQCLAINQAKYAGTYHTKGEDSCELKCLQGSNIVWKEGIAADGSRCVPDKFITDICLQGKCRKVGCDNVIESGKVRDRCGVCDGDSSSCVFKTGITKTKCSLARGFDAKYSCHVLEIPPGTVSAHIQKIHKDHDLLYVKLHKGMLWNGFSWGKQWMTEGAKISLIKNGFPDKDALNISDPSGLKYSMQIFRLNIYGNQPIKYGMIVKGHHNINLQDFKWVVGEWSTCSRSCAVGKKIRVVRCHRKDDNSFVKDAVCAKTSAKPATEQQCNNQPCKNHWFTSRWTPCSRYCGLGKQTRSIVCRHEVSEGTFKTIDDSLCTEAKPTVPTSLECNKMACSPSWTSGPWSDCSCKAGKSGVKKRSVSCTMRIETGELKTVVNLNCPAENKPSTTQACGCD